MLDDLFEVDAVLLIAAQGVGLRQLGEKILEVDARLPGRVSQEHGGLQPRQHIGEAGRVPEAEGLHLTAG